MREKRSKLVSILLAVMLIFSGLTLTRQPVRAEETQPQLPAPQNLSWTGYFAVWEAVPNATSYTLYLVEDGKTIKTFAPVFETSFFLYDWMTLGSHEYSFQVVALGPGHEESECAISPELSVDKILPQMTGVTYDEDTEILAWEAFPGAEYYYVTFDSTDGRTGTSLGVHGGHSADLNLTCRIVCMPNGIYEVNVYAYGVDPLGFGSYMISSPYTFEYKYVSKDSPAKKPTNLRWDGTVAKWDCPESKRFLVNLFEGDTIIHSFVNHYDNELDMSGYLLEGEHTYHFEVSSIEDNCAGSEWAVSPNLTYTKALPNIKGVTISSEGILSWDEFPAEVFEFTVGTLSGWVSGTSVDLLDLCWKNQFEEGSYEVTLCAFDSKDPEKREQLSETWTGTYDFKTDKPEPTRTPTIIPTVTPTPVPGEPTSVPGEPTPVEPTTAPGQPTPVEPTTKPGQPTPVEPTTKPVEPTTKPGQPSPTTAPVTPVPGDPDKDPSFEDFVERLYVVALDRASDPSGKEFWVEKVENGEYNGADCARFFLLDAPEFMQRKLNNNKFLEVLYHTFYDRDSDANGKAYWLGRLNEGISRRDVVNAFIESTEWCNVCATYGVKSGALYHKAEFASKNAINFATRLYTCCLGREPEQGGLKYWSLALTNLEQTGCSAAKNFFTSAEFIGFKLNNDEYVRRLYTTFMGRDPEASEVAYWVGEIKAGRQTKESVMAFFGQSPEFTNICKKYGIDRGTI